MFHMPRNLEWKLTKVIEKYSLGSFKLGWFIGDFEPSIYKNEAFEIGLKYFKSGQVEPSHMQNTATEITVVINGIVQFLDEKYFPGDIIKIPPKFLANFVCIEDAVLICIKYPSIPNDKIVP